MDGPDTGETGKGRKQSRIFTYYPGDFGEIPVKVVHMDLTFDVFNDHTRVTSFLTAKSLDTSLQTLTLNAKDLEIISITSEGRRVTCDYRKDESKIHLTFQPRIFPGAEFAIRTETVCHPTRNVLEGLYYDETPPGAPPTQITQCQQWGFQRLVPCIDDMTAKCTYRTTIIADNRYTHLISNGDVMEERHPAGPAGTGSGTRTWSPRWRPTSSSSVWGRTRPSRGNVSTRMGRSSPSSSLFPPPRILPSAGRLSGSFTTRSSGSTSSPARTSIGIPGREWRSCGSSGSARLLRKRAEIPRV